MALEQSSLDPVLWPFVGEVDSELIEGVGLAEQVSQSREVKEANGCGKVIATEALGDVFVEPSEEKRVQSLR